MILKKLELQGFKSFAQPVELEFDSGLTAVIGPNGSGKSNIADAMRWVLGEQSAKQLRGARMEDVIFNGTQVRKAQGFCSVALSFDNSDGTLPIDYSEVTVMRKYYRSGESEYSINKKVCRLKDIVELFRDTGIGKEGYSIVGQGRIDEILSSKPEERRAVFEEAAGVSKFRARKEEAERSLAKTLDNLTRLEDIIFELEARLGPLKEQSEKARQFLLCRDELRALELNLFLAGYDKLKDRLRGMSEECDARNEELTAAETRAEQKNALASAASEAARAIEAGIASKQSALIESTGNVEKLDGEAKLLSERLDRAREASGQSGRQLSEAELRLLALDGELEQSAGSIKDIEAKLLESQAAVQRAEAEVNAIDKEISGDESTLEELKEKVYEAMNRVSGAKVQAGRLESMLEAVKKRADELAEEIAAAIKEKQSIQLDQTEAGEGGSALEAEKAAALEEYNTCVAEQKRCAGHIDELTRRGRDIERQSDALRSKITMLREMKNAYEGYYSSVKNLLGDCKRDPVLGRGIIGVAAELMRVPKELETAIEMALGSALQNIITEDEKSAKKAIEYLRQRRYGRATFLPLTAVKPKRLSDMQRRALNNPGVLGVAAELVEYDKKYENAFSSLLGAVVIVKTLDDGIQLMKATGGTLKIATLEGDIINAGGSMTGGSVAKKEFSLLGRERETEELAARLKAGSAALDGIQAEIKGWRAKEDSAGSAVAACQNRIRIADIAIVRQNEKTDMLQSLLDGQQKRIDKLEEEQKRVDENITDIQEQLETLAGDSKKLEEGSSVSRETVDRLSEALAAKRQKQSALAQTLSGERIQHVSLQKEQSAKKADHARLEKEKQTLTALRAQLESEIAKGELDAEALQKQLEETQARITGDRADVEAQLAQIKELEAERDGKYEFIKAAEKEKQEMAEGIALLREQLHKLELSKSRSELELESMQNRIWEDYELTYDGAQEFRKELPPQAAKRAAELKNSMKELGEVNLGAVDDYKNMSERYTELSGQQQDLVKAKDDLEQLIERLQTGIRTKFKAEFANINANFGETFKELFAGGHAELRLTDPADVLSSDIEIIAQPPGKKLQLLTLLSGGERAMTAIALLFSMLKLRPAPFCLLDEIEAALDEANVANFANYVKKYAGSTQFILITHRQGSMVVCDTLYGVAMEEKGVSRIVSVNMSEAV